MTEALAESTRLWDLAARNSTAWGEKEFFQRQSGKYSIDTFNPVVHVRGEQTVNLTNTMLLEPRILNLTRSRSPLVQLAVRKHWQYI